MAYVATIPVVFPCPAAKVYDALCDLGSYPLWNSGMISVSHTGRLKEGLHYRVESMVAGGQVNVSEAEVTRLVPMKEIELVSYTGVVAYKATFRLTEHEGGTQVVCTLRFELRNFMLDLARPVIEAMAEARIRGDLEALRAIICDGKATADGGPPPDLEAKS